MTDQPALFDTGPTDRQRHYEHWHCLGCGAIVARSEVARHVLRPGHSCVPPRHHLIDELRPA